LTFTSRWIFASKGKHSFKKISGEKEVFELITGHPKAFIIAPVCRMIISDEANAVQHPEMAGLLFCSAHCMDIYRRNKQRVDVNQKRNLYPKNPKSDFGFSGLKNVPGLSISGYQCLSWYI
jgi:hypothetical protein